ncbi:DUF4352 domain-containing protein [Methanosarcina sp.]|uniref:DUF4352 domain-containing protein n=1 Tax=Methanosarcina sp. TaxID=2213 RepID=UPI003C73613F
MKKFLMSSLKIGVGVFIGLFLLIIVVGMFASDEATDNSADTTVADDPETEEVVEDEQVEAQKTGTVFDYTTWEYYVTDQIGSYYIAPAGKHYYVVTIHVDNQGTATYNTNPYYWSLTADGITYDPDTATFSESIDSKTVDVGPGGKIDVQYAYLVDGTPKDLALNYGL